MNARKTTEKQRLRKQPRMRRLYSASSTPLPGLSMPKTAKKRKQRNSRQRISRPIAGVRGVVLNTRWISLAIAALSLYALFMIGGDDRFYLNYIPVEGSSTIDINNIVAESGLASRHIFAADPQEAADRISEIGGVVTATVTLHWPNDVMIRIREKPPLATWQEGDKTFWIDDDGQLTASRAQTVGLLNIISEVPPAVVEEPIAAADKNEKPVSQETEDAATGEAEGETVEEPRASQAAFVPRDVLAGALQLRELRPNIDKLYYKPSDGLGYQDGRGWTAYFGTGRDMHQKLVVYETIVANLLERGTRPAYISVANQYKPYYRLVP
ncbi:MAG: FtsQ-type POTRA domain-containing protein [Candidatus Promineofilum sp.]|nr:FtsQ-type POTRA domain-containing protein [Promineifilum sp.]